MAAAEFRRIASLAAGGDESAIGKLQSVSQQFLEVSKEQARTALDYARDVAAVREAVQAAERYSLDQVTAGDRQLEALNLLMDAQDGMVDGIVRLGDTTLIMKDGVFQTAGNVLSVRDAVNNLDGALANLAEVEKTQGKLVSDAVTNVLAELAKVKETPAPTPAAPTSEAVGWAGYVQKNPDLAALYASGQGMARGHTIEQFAQLHWGRYGMNENRYYRPFARGGVHMGGLRLVGEEGPELEVTGPSRIYSASQTRDMLSNDNSDLAAAIDRLSDRLDEQGRALERVARSSDTTATILTRVTRDGDALVTEPAEAA